ncbi:GntP family permease [Brachybacterium fresconis]|uniref:GntP family gluconate:H+ symporter n=1 Tax=Brachybacterium fresconis TaxID=173363 RepID=A0ABS4YLM3_9MICO|nr:SLC13 family permease [Brachybacterium fresconis]MBP2409686.1 GntP family gluconate:H+ symporter [Brachybacterium fresconis]
MDPILLVALLVGIALIVVIVLKTRLDAFSGLLIASVVIGLIAGQDLPAIVGSIKEGFGSTLASIGIVIGLGVAIGKILEVSGAAQAIAVAFLRLFGKGREPWAMTSIGALISIPVFCDSGYVIMNPLARAIARVKKYGYATLGIALAGGMVITHHFVPPTPGPLGVAGILGASVGSVILVGLVFTLLMIPVVTVYAKWIGPRVEHLVSEEIQETVYGDVRAERTPASVGAGSGSEDVAVDLESLTSEDTRLGERPEGAKPHRVGPAIGLLPLVVPIVLIVLNTVVSAIDMENRGMLPADYEPSAWAGPFVFIGDPVIALLIGLVLAVYLLLPRWTPRKRSHKWLGDAAADAGLILLITGAGGGLGQVLRDTGIGDELAQAIGGLPLPSFLLPFLIASIVRIAQGSGTVSMITAASVTAPVMATIGLDPLVAVMACVAGAMVCSYFNDSYFWVVTRFMGLEGTAALKAHSGMTTVMWAASIPMLFVLSLVLGASG